MAIGTGKRVKLPSGRAPVIAAIDIGTTKVTCLVAQVEDESANPEIRVLGIGHQASRGVRAGTIADMDAAEDVVRACVEHAEEMAGTTVISAMVNISSASARSRIIREEVNLHHGEVNDGDVRRVLRDAHSRVQAGNRQTLHTIPIGFSVDGSKGIRDPRGMLGDKLSIRLNEICVDPSPLRNIGVCVERCHIEPEGPIFSAYASSLGALVEDELELGVTLIELGGGTTSVASFFEGRMIFAKSFPVGGNHVTQDIARGLSTPMVHAERMKVLFGSTMASPHDDREMIDVPPIGEEQHRAANHVPRSILVGIVKPRIEETFEFIREELANSGVERVAGHRIVLTGGASQLNGLREYAGRYFDAHVRIGRPRGLKGLPEAATGPAFSTAGGLLAYGFRAPEEDMGAAPGRLATFMGLFGLGRGTGRSAA